MDVYWLEQINTDVPATGEWLSQQEACVLEQLRFPKRRSDWRLGRWTAKNAVALSLDMPAHADALARIEIRPAASGAPEVFLANQAGPVTVSLSHRDGAAVCAVAPSPVALGCDLEIIEPRGDPFVTDYFTAEEQALIAGASGDDRNQLLALLWSAKESALKALCTGLRLDTRCINVTFSETPQSCGGWHPLQVNHDRNADFHGWWQQTGNRIKTVVAAPPPRAPIALQIQAAVKRTEILTAVGAENRA